MGSRYVDDLIDDDEVPELTEADFARMIPFSELPEEEQRFLLSIKGATIKPDPVRPAVSVSLPADLVDRFKASFGEDWEYKIEGALRHWLVEHPPAVKLAKAS